MEIADNKILPRVGRRNLNLSETREKSLKSNMCHKKDTMSERKNDSDVVSTASNKKNYGRWTFKEHKAFEYALKVYGKNWKKIEAYVGTRSGNQIRSHAQKHFLKEEAYYRNEMAKYTANIPAETNNREEEMKSDSNDSANKGYLLAKQREDTIIEQLEIKCNIALYSLANYIQQHMSLSKNLQIVREEFVKIRGLVLVVINAIRDEFKPRCSVILEITNFEIEEIDQWLSQYNRLKDTKPGRVELPYLVQHIGGLGSNRTIPPKHNRLSDWVDMNYNTINPWVSFNLDVDMAIMNWGVNSREEAKAMV